MGFKMRALWQRSSEFKGGRCSSYSIGERDAVAGPRTPGAGMWAKGRKCNLFVFRFIYEMGKMLMKLSGEMVSML